MTVSSQHLPESGPVPPYSGSDPTPFISMHSTLCSLGMRTWTMPGVLRTILMRQFASADTIEEGDLRKLLWQPGERTGILIESLWNWQPQTTGIRPAVIIKRNAQQNFRVGLADRYLGKPVDAQGFEHFATYWIGSCTLFCIGGNGLQAELIATEVQRHLTQFALVILESLDLKRFQVQSVGEISLVEEEAQHAMVPVTVGYAFEEKWMIRPNALPLRFIPLTMLTG